VNRRLHHYGLQFPDRVIIVSLEHFRSVCSVLAKLLHVIAIVLVGDSACAAPADVSSQLVVTMSPEIRVIERRGKDENVRYIPATEVEQGQEIYYTVRILNASNEKVKRAMVIQPVPANTRLIERSVTGAGAALSFSVDGGKNFVSLTELRNSNAGSPPKVTHIRWQFKHPLAPHVVVLARFRVVFD